MELDEAYLDERIDAIKTDFPLLVHHSEVQTNPNDTDSDDEDQITQGRLPPLVKISVSRRQFFAKLFVRTFHLVRAIHSDMDDLRILVNSVYAMDLDPTAQNSRFMELYAIERKEICKYRYVQWA